MKAWEGRGGEREGDRSQSFVLFYKGEVDNRSKAGMVGPCVSVHVYIPLWAYFPLCRSIVDQQCCVNFRYDQSISAIHMSILFQISFPTLGIIIGIVKQISILYSSVLPLWQPRLVTS